MSKNPHMVSEGENPNEVLTVAQLKAILNSGTYADDSIVMLTEDATVSRQATGLFTACDNATGKCYLVITSRKDAQTETYHRVERV